MLNNFTIGGFRFRIAVASAMGLPAYKGGTFRGGFGYTFKRIVCAARGAACDTCMLKQTCVYSKVFETPLPDDAEMLRLYPKIPHPFVIEPPLTHQRRFGPGDELEFGLVLIGKAIDFLPYFVFTFVELGKVGIGRDRGKYTLQSVHALDAHGAPAPVYDHQTQTIQSHFPRISTGDGQVSGTDSEAEDREPGTPAVPAVTPATENPQPKTRAVSVSFLTPLRVRYQGHYTDQIDFHVLIRNLLRRVSALSYFHCGERLDCDFKGLINAAQEVATVDSSLEWRDWTRYSTRQKRDMTLGGVVGTVTYEGPFLSEHLTLLRLGEHIHLGKGTAFGLGQYHLPQP